MAGFGLATEPLTHAAGVFTELAGKLSQVDTGGKGMFDDATRSSLTSLSASLSTAANTATATSTACASQESADAAFQASDPTPRVIEQEAVAYQQDRSWEKYDEIQKLIQERKDALDAHTHATEGTQFPNMDDLPDHGGDGKDAGTDGDGPIKKGNDTDHDGGGAADDGSMSAKKGGDEPKPPTDPTPDPAPPSATSPSTPPAPQPVSDTSAGTSLSGDTAVMDKTSALSAPSGMGSQAPANGQGISGGQPTTGAGTMLGAPSTGAPLTPGQAERRRKEEGKREALTDVAEAGTVGAAAMMPEALHNAQGYNIPGQAPTHTTLSGSESRLGAPPPTGTTGGGPGQAHGGPAGPNQSAVQGMGAGMSAVARNAAVGNVVQPQKPPPPADPFADMEKPLLPSEMYAPPPPAPAPMRDEPAPTGDGDDYRRAMREKELKKKWGTW